jgi:hypothetical protein
MDLIYVETTVIGNIAGRIHSNPDVASRQRTTRTWWNTAVLGYELVISQLVIDECGDGDPAAAQERLDVINDLTVLAITDDARALARMLNDEGAVPTVRTARRLAHCRCGSSTRTILGDVEFQAHRQRHNAIQDRAGLP